ncbi:class I SAM-dependent methyltransferase [Pseudoduganella plicata]|uniref:Class I SAM-dependent methyltransferase n=1 Tax=Pseudoduganella plicata TaxID=321984 RepID=A0A4P7BKW3_9BURK|nr:class I SAM-dependent methyltransferase [Pseudoduganella plicata]QBQ38847.1 class I SAM-dependent methyltransferase [Pseudoduganella plicata]GGY85538.1 hypothetical protein GCM10007388_18580 [Pseudoduganella plicata]
MINQDLNTYYTNTAAELENAYNEPERQDDLEAIAERVADLLDGHTVLELACGTGYWTRRIAASADSVHAIDINETLLALAREETPDNATYAQGDAFDLPAAVGQYTAVFAAGWWSHVRREQAEKYLAHLRAQLGKDVLLVLVDNCYVEGSTTVTARTDLEGNTFQLRQVGSERFEVMENFPTDSYLRKKFAGAVREIRVRRNDHYWLLTGRLK